MNSFMKAKNEEKKSSNCEATVKPTEKKEETKTSSGFTYKDFQKSINEKESKSKTSFPEELSKEAKLPIPTQTNPNSSLVVEKKDNEKLNEKLANEELEKEKEKKTKDNYEEETESESESDIEFESYDDDDEYKIVKIKLIPFIFTEKYEQVKGFIKDSRITCYSLLNVINNGIMSDIEIKEIEDRIKDKLVEILKLDDYLDIDCCMKIKLNKYDDSKFYFDCYIKIYKWIFDDNLINDDNKITKYTKQKYQKHYKDIYKKEYDAKEDFFDYFKYLKDFLNIYLKIIYGYKYYSDEISTIIDDYFTINRVNPFTYNENIIPFREIRTKSKDVIKTTIMKMGFIFDDIREIFI